MDGIPSKIKVLVTDAGHKNALACVRSLGKRGFKIGCIGTPSQTLSFYSKYCHWKHLINLSQSKGHDESIERYAKALLKIIKKNNYDVLIPVGLQSCLTASKYKDDFEKHINVSIIDWETMKIAYLKHESMKFAREIGVNVPKSISIKSDEDLTHAENLSFPIALKTSDSGAGSLKYCNTKDEFVRNYKTLKRTASTTVLAQEYELVVMVEKSRTIAKIVGKQFGVNYYTNHQNTLKKESLDAVAICTPPKSHYQASLAALDYGINVFCEKSLFISLKGVREIFRKTEGSKVVHQVGYGGRFYPTFLGDIVYNIKGMGYSGEEVI